MIKHELVEWAGIGGPKRSWWYKMQLFNADHHQGNLLYFDLDCVIIRNLDWLPNLPTTNFWTIRDFRYLQRQNHLEMNSSVMWWNVAKFAKVWHDFEKLDINDTVKRYPGDQDYLGAVIPTSQRRYFEGHHLQSWRWQALDGGYDFTRRQAFKPGSGAKVTDESSILVFHGRPKPHECTNHPVIADNWR